MDIVVDEEVFAIETVTSHTQFLQNKPPERSPKSAMYPIADERNNGDIDMGLGDKCPYTIYSDNEKTRFFYLFFNKCLSARAAAKQLCIHPRTAQRWVKRYFEDPESIFEIKKKTGRPRILGDDHEQFVVNFIDKNPFSVVTEVFESLIQNFPNIKVSRSTVYNFMTNQCNLSIKKAQFHPEERNSVNKIDTRYEWVQKWQQTDMDYTKKKLRFSRRVSVSYKYEAKYGLVQERNSCNSYST